MPSAGSFGSVCRTASQWRRTYVLRHSRARPSVNTRWPPCPASGAAEPNATRRTGGRSSGQRSAPEELVHGRLDIAGNAAPEPEQRGPHHAGFVAVASSTARLYFTSPISMSGQSPQT